MKNIDTSIFKEDYFMVKSCFFTKKIIQYVDKELSNKLDKFTTKHLLGCSSCRDQLIKTEKNFYTINRKLPNFKFDPFMSNLTLSVKTDIQTILSKRYPPKSKSIAFLYKFKGLFMTLKSKKKENRKMTI